MNRSTRFWMLAVWLATASNLLAQSNAPSVLAGTAPAYNRVVLTWKDNTTNEAKFEIERKDFTSFTKVGEAGANATTYTDNTVQGSGSYTYRVRAILATGAATAYSGEVTVTTPATPPTTPTSLAAATLSTSAIRLTWTNPGAGTATDFLLERAASSGGPFTQVAVVPYSRTPTYDDGGLSSGTQYCYRVRARGPGGTSDYSNVACATTTAPAPTPPVTPTGLAVSSISTNQLQVFWQDANVVPVTFEVSRASSAGGTYQVISADFGQKIYTDNNLSANTPYCYKVRAKNSAGLYSGYSNEACGTTKAPTPTVPVAPARLTATAVSSSQINLQWADLSDNETGFQIERAPNSSGTFTKIADVAANATTYSDNGLSGSTSYCYRVRAVNGVGPGGYTDTQCATTPAAPAGVPQNLAATAASTTQINLSWSGVSGASGHQLERSPNGNDGWVKIADPAAAATTYSDPNLTPNTRYFYRIRALNAAGAPGGYSNTADATTPDAPPAAPARLTATAVSFSQINLQWADLSGNESGFQLERSPNGSDGWTKIADIAANATSYSNPNLSPRTRYFYRLRAINGAGPSDYSNVADATTPDSPPATPARLTATAASNTQIDLNWADVSDNETGFEVERSTDGVTFQKIADVGANGTTYQNTGLTPNTRYYYRIRAKNAVGLSAYSNVADATTPDVPPAAPARLTATATSPTQVALSWADLSGNESGFQLERGSSATGSFTKVADIAANATTYTDNNLADVTPYCYRIRAINAAGPSGYTDAVCVTTPLAPAPAPTDLTAQVQDYDQIKLTWAAVSPKAVTISIERSTSASGPFTEIKQVPAATTTYADPGLAEFTTYYYRIRAINTAGNSGFSNVASARINEVVIAVEDELDTHTDLYVGDRTLYVVTNWFSTAVTTLHLLTPAGQPLLTDHRTVRPADRWQYNLAHLSTGVYLVHIVADGRKLTKRILLP